MSEQAPVAEHSWDSGWDGHERAQLRRKARLPLWQKLQWLEEINRIARHLREQRKPHSTGPEGPPPGTAH
jgi:hypothetical protein